MRDIWISSDTHLYHDNILKFTRNDGTPLRPGFDNANQMNEFILEQHNSVVKKGDIYYTLGDVVMGRPEGFKSFFNLFNGSKRLIVGNHDDIKWLASLGLFQKIQMWRKFKEHGIIMSHVPLHESSLGTLPGDPPLLNVHGHIHAHNSPKGPYVNLSMEKINYKPVHIDALYDLWKEQQKVHEPVAEFSSNFDPGPYFDDFDPNKKYERIIFQPSKAIT